MDDVLSGDENVEEPTDSSVAGGYNYTMKVIGGTEEDKNIDQGRLMHKDDAIRKGAHSK